MHFSSRLQTIPDAALRPDDGLRADLAQPAPQAVRRPLPERKADEKAEKAGHDRHGGRIRIITAQAK